mgnify:FL=1
MIIFLLYIILIIALLMTGSKRKEEGESYKGYYIGAGVVIAFMVFAAALHVYDYYDS